MRGPYTTPAHDNTRCVKPPFRFVEVLGANVRGASAVTFAVCTHSLSRRTGYQAFQKTRLPCRIDASGRTQHTCLSLHHRQHGPQPKPKYHDLFKHAYHASSHCSRLQGKEIVDPHAQPDHIGGEGHQFFGMTTKRGRALQTSQRPDPYHGAQHAVADNPTRRNEQQPIM